MRRDRLLEAVEVHVHVTESRTGERRSFVLRRASLGFPGDPDDWAAETITALRTIHDDDVYAIFACYRDEGDVDDGE